MSNGSHTLLSYMTSLKPRHNPNYTIMGHPSTRRETLDYIIHGSDGASGSSNMNEVYYTSKAGPGVWSYSDNGLGLSTDTPCSWNSSINSSFYACNFSVSVNSTASVPGSQYPTWLIALFAILAGATSFVTIVGNFIVVLSFILERGIRQPTNYFIASLALSDLVIGGVSMPFYTVYLLLGKHWPLGEVVCDLWLATDYTVCLVSQYTVLFITVDRFCSVRIPAKYRNWRTDTKVLNMVLLAWIVPAGLFFVSIIGWQYFVGKRTVPQGACYVQFMENPLFSVLLTVGYFWVTLIIMIILYAGIYNVALGLQKKSEAKRKKMTSLVSMAGETMTKIGIGMSKQRPPAEKYLKPEELHTPLQHRTSTTSFTSKNDGEDRSSSPALPSDTDPSSQSPKQESKRPHSLKKGGKSKKSKKEKQAKAGLVNDSKIENHSLSPTVLTEANSSKVTNEKQQQMPSPGFPSATSLQSTNHVTFQSPVASPDGVAVSNGNELVPVSPCSDGSIKQDLQNVPPQSDVLIEPELESRPNDCDMQGGCPPPDYLIGLRYIDQESLKAMHTSDNVKLLADCAQTTDDPFLDSPVWQPRDPETGTTLQHIQVSPLVSPDGPSALPGELPAESYFRPIVPSSALLETVSENNKTVSRIAQTPPHQSERCSPQLNEPQCSDKERLHQETPVRNVVKRERSRKGRRHHRSKRDKQKSKSENRARKALRTITLILGAFVVCWTPYHIMILIVGACESCVNETLYDISYFLCYLNSPINPFCYALANQQFKKAFIRILKLDWHRS